MIKGQFWQFIFIAFGITLLAAIFSFPHLSLYAEDAGHDGHWYILLAEGRVGEVMEPFTGRILYPIFAGTLHMASTLAIGESFFVVGIISLFAFLTLNFAMLRSVLPVSALVAPLFIVPYFFIISREILLPDVFYIALTALFFYVLRHEKYFASLLVLFLLFLTREITIVLALIVLITSIVYKKKMLFWGTIAVIVTSIFIGGHVGEYGIPNPHDLDGIVYLSAKLSFNFLHNIFGLEIWVNTLVRNCEPFIRTSLPVFSAFGAINEVGLCSPSATFPLITARALLSTFGIMPLILFFLFSRMRWKIFRGTPLWLVIATVSGVAFFLLGVVAGTGVERIVGYGWAAFLLGTPFFIRQYFVVDKLLLVKLSVAHVSVAWVPFILHAALGASMTVAVLSIVFIAPVYLMTFLLLKRQRIALPRMS